MLRPLALLAVLALAGCLSSAAPAAPEAPAPTPLAPQAPAAAEAPVAQQVKDLALAAARATHDRVELLSVRAHVGPAGVAWTAAALGQPRGQLHWEVLAMDIEPAWQAVAVRAPRAPEAGVRGCPTHGGGFHHDAQALAAAALELEPARLLARFGAPQVAVEYVGDTRTGCPSGQRTIHAILTAVPAPPHKAAGVARVYLDYGSGAPLEAAASRFLAQTQVDATGTVAATAPFVARIPVHANFTATITGVLEVPDQPTDLVLDWRVRIAGPYGSRPASTGGIHAGGLEPGVWRIEAEHPGAAAASVRFTGTLEQAWPRPLPLHPA